MFGRRLAAQLGRLFVPAAPRKSDQQRVVQLQEELLIYLNRVRRDDDLCSRREGSTSAGPSLPVVGSGSHPCPAVGFELQRRPSNIPGAGRGVFLTRGSIQRGSVVTLYPGIVQSMADFVTQLSLTAADEAVAPMPPPWCLHNHYLLYLTCLHQSVFIDGQPHGISAQRFLSAAAASSPGAALNTRWLEPGSWAECRDQAHAAAPLLQAALGNMINHSSEGATTAFDLCPLPTSLPPRLLRILPSLNLPNGRAATVRWVPLLVALTSLDAAQHGTVELLVDYGTNPHGLGYHA